MKVSPYQAVQMLVAQSRGYLRLSDQMFDNCFDALSALLEQANNQKGAAFTRHSQLRAEDVEYDAQGVAIDVSQNQQTTVIPKE